MGDFETSFLHGPFPVDLVEIGLSHRTSVVCVAKYSSKVFVAFKLVQEIQKKSFPGHFTLLITENTSDSFIQEFTKAISLQTPLKYCIATNSSEIESCNIDIQISSSNHMIDSFNSDTIPWNKINLVIIDNCHLATIEDHPLRSIINFFRSNDCAECPIIVGVTANLPVASSSHLRSVINGMESVFGCSCHVSSDLVALNRYGEIPQENSIRYSFSHSNETVSNEVNTQFLQILEFIEQQNRNEDRMSKSVFSQIRSWYNTFSSILRRFGSSAALYNAKILQREVIKMLKKSTNVSDTTVLNYCKEKLNFIQKNYSDSPDRCEVTQLVHEILSSLWIVKSTRRNIENATNLTTDNFAGNSPLMEYIQKCEENFKRSPVTAIICLSDSEAAALNCIFNQVSKTNTEFSCIKSAYISSSNIRQSETSDDEREILSQAIVQLMNKGEINVLVFSCDVENEVHVASCKQLIRFGLPQDYPSYVKVKRIVRTANAEVIFVEEVDNWKDNDMNMHQVFKDIESVLFKHCEPCRFAIKDRTYWNKLANMSESKCCDSRLAIAVINRYCSSFPNDGYSSPHPRCAVRVEEDSEKVKLTSTLHLPRHSPIYWPFQVSISLPREHATPTHIAEAHSQSLIAVATLAYKTMQETGELDRQGPRVSFNSDIFKKADIPCTSEVRSGCHGNDGSTKRKRAYFRKFPPVLMNNLPIADNPAYLYHISLSTSNVSGDPDLVASYSTSNMLGLLSRNRLPKIPMFIIYSKATELTVTITMCTHPITLTTQQLELVKRFHTFIHQEILYINSDPENEWFQFEPEKQTYGVYIVPVIDAKVKANSEDGNVMTDFIKTERDEIAKCGDENIEAVADYQRKDFSCCLNLQKLNIQDQLDNTMVDPNNDVESSRENNFSQQIEWDFSRDTRSTFNRSVGSDVSDSIDNNSLRQKSCSLPSAVELDFDRHVACDFQSHIEFDSKLQVAFNFLSNIEQDLGDLLDPKDPSPQILSDFEHYRGRVVTAVYMNKPTRYIVTDIASGMTPLSPFPDPEVAPTFSDYFKQRYGLEVREDQPLLQVKSLPRVTNALVSKYRDSKGHERPLPSRESKRHKRSHTLLIPELCSIHPVPLSIWKDAVLLPTILYRLEAILLAEELRQTIALQAGVGDVKWPDDAEMPLISLGESVGECETEEKSRYDYACCNSGSGCEDDENVVGGDIVCESDHVSDFGGGVVGDSVVVADVGCGVVGDCGDDGVVDDGCCVGDGGVVGDGAGVDDGGVVFCDVGGVFDCDRSLDDDAGDVVSDEAAHSSYHGIMVDVASYDGKESVNSNHADNNGYNHKQRTSVTPQDQGKNTCHHHCRRYRHLSYSKCPGGENNTFKTIEASKHPSSTSADPSDISIQTSVSKQPSSTLLLKALTCASAIDVFNHDRIELYGDSFIKFAVSLNIFCKYPCVNVGRLSFYRGLAISNRQLLYLGRSTDIPSCIINQKFQPLINWCPHGFNRILSNIPQDCRLKLTPDSNEFYSSDNDDDVEADVSPSDVKSTQDLNIDFDAYEKVVLSDKTVADTTEAIIGAYLVTGGGESALNVMKWLGFDITDYFNTEYVSYFMKEAGYAKPTNQNDQGSKCMSSFIEQTGHTKPTNQNKLSPVWEHVASFIIRTEDYDPTRNDHPSLRLSECSDRDVVLKQEQDNEEDDEKNCSPVNFSSANNHLIKGLTNVSDITTSLLYEEVEVSEEPITSKAPMTITPSNQMEKDIRLLEEEFKGLEISLGYVFNNKMLLHQALTHVSYPRDFSHVTSCYEQLEFLGDALLDYLVTRHLYFTHINMTPGGLTDLRSAIVNSYSFAFLSVHLGLHNHLRSMSPAVYRVNNKFVSVLRNSVEKKMMAQPDQLCASVFVPPDDSDENSEGIEVPKVLADIFESVIAAVFLDCGMDVELTWLVIYKLLKPTFDHYADHPPCSPVRQLKEMLPNDVCFSACELAITGRYTCTAHVTGYGKFKGSGRNPKIARSTAAQKALANIQDRKR